MWDLPSWIFWKRWCMIFTTVTPRECTQTRLCYLSIQIPSHTKFKRIMYAKTFMLISFFSIFWVREKSPFCNGENKQVIGKMKDELNRKIIEKFVALKVKMYLTKTKAEDMSKAKRVKRKLFKKDISHQDYVDCLFEEIKSMHTMQIIQSFKHQPYTIKQNKVSLSPYNDKWYLLDDGVSSLPYSHFSLL